MFVPVTHVVSAVIGEACPGQLYWRGGVGCVWRFVGGGSTWLAQDFEVYSVYCLFCSCPRSRGRDWISVKQMLSRQLIVDKI